MGLIDNDIFHKVMMLIVVLAMAIVTCFTIITPILAIFFTICVIKKEF